VRGVRSVLAGLLLTLACGAASSQDGFPGGAPGRFNFYVLALSWSPQFCATSERRSSQCESGRRLGFVVHGLWPQYERGYPRACGEAAGGPPRPALEEALRVYPDAGLARHEWRVHGTCSGLPPAEYFRTVGRAREMVTVPDPLVGLAQDAQTSAQSLERAFVAVNPGLRADMISVVCRRGDLQEVRICLERDLRGFRSCPAVERRSCGFGPIRVPAPR
jgi:ribonuclease T2